MLLCPMMILQSQSGRTQPVLTLDPDWPQIFTGERISLRCQGNTGSEFLWVKHEPHGQRHDVHRSRGDSYTIPSAAGEHSGSYECCYYVTEWTCSKAITLTVSALPWATLTVEPEKSLLYTGETVTLKCEVDSHSNWKYVWYKGRSRKVLPQTADHSVSGDRYSITAAAGSDQGQYWCAGRLEGRKVTSQRSDPITLTVKGRTQPVLTLDPDWPQIFTGERITLRCQSQEDTSKGFSWYKGGNYEHQTYSSRENSYTISSATDAHSGSYTCCLVALHDTCSAAVRLTVSEKPRPVLSVSLQGRIYAGESVSLSCRVTVPSAGREYYWYKDVRYYGSYDNPLLSRGVKDSYTLSPAALTHSGEYRCRAGRGNPVWVTEYSEPVHIQVSALPKATLTVEPKWSLLYTGETVTLKCEVDSHSNWKYVWYKGQSRKVLSQTAGHSVSGDRYSITVAAESDQGQYWCEGTLEGRKVTSQRSDPITLTVEVLPKANLTVEPKWSPLYTGDNITLKCEVDSPGNWMYVWYKDQFQTAMSQTAGHSVSGDRYSITAAAGSDQGQYWCEGRLEGRKVTSQRSDPFTLTFKDQSIITLAIALGAVAALIVSVLILIFFVKRRRSRGSPCLACLHSDSSSLNTQVPTAVEMQTSPVVQTAVGNQAAGSSSEPLYSQIDESNKKRNREDEGNPDVLYSSLVLDDKKKKKKQRRKNTEGSDQEVVYSTVRTG